MLPPNLEAEFHSNKNELVRIIDKTSEIIYELRLKVVSNTEFELMIPQNSMTSNSILILKDPINMNLNHPNYFNHKIIEDALLKAEEYLKKIKTRMQDNSSRVLITGDLNSGKSTLINALLGQNILPTDQQPCTQSFCEIIPSDEEILNQKILAYKLIPFHANCESIEIGSSNFQEELQNEDSEFKWFKISVSVPLHSNFIQNQIEVSLIDSPGLNTDLFKTTSLLNQQQDIDVIVFVINAAFHLTLSGREFLEQAAREKEKIFFVVNKFDEIVNFKKCRKVITKQIREILPGTFEDAQNLIHFVSAKEYIQGLNDTDNIPITDIGASSEIKKHEEISNLCFVTDFEYMKQSLLNFLYLKRSISKLSPAKTYSFRLLQELFNLTSFNLKKLKSDLHDIDLNFKESSIRVKNQEKEESELKSNMNAIVAKTSDKCFTDILNIGISFADEISKSIKHRRYSGIWYLHANILEKYQQVAQSYSQTIIHIESKTSELKQSGLSEMNSLSEFYKMKLECKDVTDHFKLTSRMPLPKPSILELIDPNEFLHNFGALNLTSVVGATVGFQPLINFIWKCSQRVGFNPLFIGTIILGGLGTFAIYTASSSIEKAIFAKLENYFILRFNKEIWAVDLAERCRQNITVSLSSRSSQILVAYNQILNQNRHELAEISKKSDELGKGIENLNIINKKIEILLQSCTEIKL